MQMLPYGAQAIENPLGFDEAKLRELIGDEAFAVLRLGATEPAFQGIFTDTDEPGDYFCAACDALIFTAAKKFHSGCGWPSFLMLQTQVQFENLLILAMVANVLRFDAAPAIRI